MNTVSANGIDVAYELVGSGPVVMFIGGIGMDIAAWKKAYIPAFLEKGYQALIVNPRGIPPSSVTAPPYTVDLLAADCRAVLDALEIGECYVVGASLGAFVAQELALQHPAGKLGLALIATTLRQTAWVKMVTLAELALYDRPETLPVDYIVALDLLQLFTVDELCDDNLVRKMTAYLKSRDHAEVGRRGLFSAVGQYAGCVERLPNLSVPTLFVSFADDALTPARPVREAAARVPRSRYLEIEGCGHFGIFSQSTAIRAAICNYFEEIARESQAA